MSRLVAKGGDGHPTVHRLEERLGCSGLVAVKQGVAPTHAEMGEQDTAVIEVHQEVLCSPSDVHHGGSCKGSKVLGKGVAQAFSSDEDIVKRLALHALHQALANGFNLGKFRHAQASGFRTTNRR